MDDNGYVCVMVVTQILTKNQHLEYNIVMISLQSLVVDNVA